MKNLLMVWVLMSTLLTNAQAQKLLVSETAEIKFFSKAPLEDIEAVSHSLQSVIRTESKDIVVKVAIKSFEFPNKLMQSHFNENYMDSEKFPYATFSGKILEDIDFSKNAVMTVSAVGKLTIHGVEHEQTLTGKLSLQGDKMILDARFDVLLTDHKIDVPKLVFSKIAEKINVTCKFVYGRKFFP